jgi:hypothetical protein
MGYLNSDDLLFPGTLRRVHQAFEGYTGSRPRLVSFAGLEFGEGIESVLHAPAARPRLDTWVSGRTSLFQPSSFWNRALWERLGGFREDLKFCFDKEFFLRAVFREGAYQPVPGEPLAKFRVHADSKTARLSDVMRRENALIAVAMEKEDWARRILRAERQENLARTTLYGVFETNSLVEKTHRLLSAGLHWPSLLRERIFWGAAKHSLREALRRSHA